MAPWLMNALMHGGMALKRYLEGGAQPAAPTELNLTWYAVPPANLRGFVAEHPRALDPDDLVEALRQRGVHVLADDVEAGFVTFARRHWGCAVLVEIRG